MDGRFLTAFILPESWSIMGYKLKPFSLRHTMTLTALESPIVAADGPRVKPEDIVIFLRVCSSDNAFVALSKPSLWDRWCQARMEVDTTYYFDQLMAINAYIKLCNTMPNTYNKDEGQEKKKENVPVVLGLATSLMSKLNFNKDEAWDCTVGQAVWYLTAYAVSEGADVKIISTQDEAKMESEKEFLARMQKQARERLKKGANK
jgi:hypothetical protein